MMLIFFTVISTRKVIFESKAETFKPCAEQASSREIGQLGVHESQVSCFRVKSKRMLINFDKSVEIQN